MNAFATDMLGYLRLQRRRRLDATARRRRNARRLRNANQPLILVKNLQRDHEISTPDAVAQSALTSTTGT